MNESAFDDLSEIWKSFDEADGHFFTDDLSNIFPMPEIQKPPNLSLQKLIQKTHRKSKYKSTFFGTLSN